MTYEQENLYAMRMKAHAAVDALWMNGYMTRQSAYNFLARHMNMKPEDCHIALFTVEQCQKAILAARERLRREEVKDRNGGNLFPGVGQKDTRKQEHVKDLSDWADEVDASPGEEIF